MLTMVESHVLLEIEPMLSLEEFMDRYRAFCEQYGYEPQRTYEILGEIEDVLVLAAVTGPHQYWLRLPAGINHEAWQRGGTVAASFEQWPERVYEARKLYKQVFHLREGATDMTLQTLSRGKLHLEQRAPVLVHGISRLAETLR